MRIRLTVFCLAAMLGTSSLSAQARSSGGPWTIKVTPTLDPLPAGLCAAVHVAVSEQGSTEPPRNPAGYKVTAADFDMTVSATDENAVTGQRIDASHWSVCTCQGAAAGTVATITAKYPAESLASRSRVPDVVMEQAASFTTAAAKGSINPRGCRTPSAPAVAQSGPAGPVPAPSTPVAVGPPVAKVPGKQAPLPLNLRLEPSPPMIARMKWDAVPGAKYSVVRTDAVGQTKKLKTQESWAVGTDGYATYEDPRERIDTVADQRMVYRYAVVVSTYDSLDQEHTAESTPVSYTSAAPGNPTGFTAKGSGDGKMDFAWQAVEGAMQYRLDGPGIPSNYHTTGTSVTLSGIPGGQNTWKLTALFGGNAADYATATTASAITRAVPPHAQKWLSKNGTGTDMTVQIPLRMFQTGCTYVLPYGLLNREDLSLNAASWVGGHDYCAAPNDQRYGLQWWLNMDLPLWGEPAQYANEAVYGNAIDLGVGRRTYCMQGGPGVGQQPFGLITTCYATAHGVRPGQPGFNELATITKPEPGIGNDFILSMVITKDDRGSSFLVFVNNGSGGYRILANKVALDTEGPKFVPQVCMACHGGKLDPATGKAIGASFLPLDPGLLAFESPAAQAAQEEKIRQVNAIIVNSAPASAVAGYIRGLYGNAVSVPGTKAKADFIPPGWQEQSGLYRSVVKKYCTSCHLAAPADVNFTTWANFQDNGGRIHAAVCLGHSMPNAELQYRDFWLADTGPVYLPGMLAASLGFESC